MLDDYTEGTVTMVMVPAFVRMTTLDGDNALKVSYFLRDAASGTEFGGNAVHISDFSPDEAWMTNQETGLFSGDITGFDYPDLNGGPLVPGDNVACSTCCARATSWA